MNPTYAGDIVRQRLQVQRLRILCTGHEEFDGVGLVVCQKLVEVFIRQGRVVGYRQCLYLRSSAGAASLVPRKELTYILKRVSGLSEPYYVAEG